MELLNNLSSELNQPLSSHVHVLLDYFSTDGFPDRPNTAQQPPDSNHLHFPLAGNHQGIFCPFDQTNAHMAQRLPWMEGAFDMERHQKSTMPMSEFSEITPSPGLGSESGENNKNNGLSGRKRKRKNEGEVGKPREVIHVRAKRGQATDSHSLAERVRRERINEKLRVLHDLVPGCYKTMGMAVMLDVIINYVRSLQNQIEFLSMKLSAASLFYDFNSPEAEALETLQKTRNPYEAHEMERMMRDQGYGGLLPQLQSTWPF